MISVQEVADSFAGVRGSVGDANTLRECIIESLVSLGASPNAGWDFDGPRRKTVYTLDDAAEQLVERYLGGVHNVGEAIVLTDAIEGGLKKSDGI